MWDNNVTSERWALLVWIIIDLCMFFKGFIMANSRYTVDGWVQEYILCSSLILPIASANYEGFSELTALCSTLIKFTEFSFYSPSCFLNVCPNTMAKIFKLVTWNMTVDVIISIICNILKQKNHVIDIYVILYNEYRPPRWSRGQHVWLLITRS